MTLNLSKSVNCALLVVLAIFLAHEVAAHFSANLNESISFFKLALFNPIWVILSFKLVKVNLLIESSCLATPVVGPSTNTLLALMTSTTTANFPANGP